MPKDILHDVCRNTDDFIATMPKERRKGYGQFFTSEATARYMAAMFSLAEFSGKDCLKVLDAGSGSGILATALTVRIVEETDKDVLLTLYESDPNILPLLADNMERLKGAANGRIHYTILTDNYITSRASTFGNQGLFPIDNINKGFDLVIGNPPYKKISKDAPEALAMPEVCHGAPNLYSLFMAMGISDLAAGGQMVYIIPRSWTSGAYFASFRRYLFANASLEQIHLFESRDKVFDRESVLQETMIVKLGKTTSAPTNIKVTTSATSADFSQSTMFEVATSVIVAGREKYVFLVTNEAEATLLDEMNKMKQTLPDLGLRMRTGLVVDFRSRELLRNEQEPQAVPLFYSRHINGGRVRFPAGAESEYIVTDKQGLVQRNKNYLFVKRFTAKEEHRRLQCGIYLKRNLPQYDLISTQNKLNFIDSDRELSECIVFGLYVLFNSTAYDTYYRLLNGSTQVNSTEVNAMPVPTLADIERIGKELIRTKDLTEEHCDEIIERQIFSNIRQ